MNPIYKEIAPDVQRALGKVMVAECKGRNVPTWTVASRGEFSQSTLKAITTGKRRDGQMSSERPFQRGEPT